MQGYKELLLISFILSGLFLLFSAGINRKVAERIQCADHLRSIYKLNVLYQNDHGILPPVWVPTKPQWKFWTNYLRKYIDSDTIFCCPADPQGKLFLDNRDPLFSFKRCKRSSYGMNERLPHNFGKKGMTLAELEYPCSFIFFGDGICGVLRIPTMPGKLRHFQKVQYVFGDGHTALYALSELRIKLKKN